MSLIKLSELDMSIERLVDFGVWSLLVGSHSTKNDVKYALCTSTGYYFLDKDGDVISYSQSLTDFCIKDVARFSPLEFK